MDTKNSLQKSKLDGNLNRPVSNEVTTKSKKAMP